MTCDKLIKYGRPPLAKNDEKVRHELVNCLEQSSIYDTTIIPDDSMENIIRKLPQGIRALILHERNIYETKCEGQYFLRCSLLFDEGNVNYDFKSKLYDSTIITHWITKSKFNIVVNGISFKLATL